MAYSRWMNSVWYSYRDGSRSGNGLEHERIVIHYSIEDQFELSYTEIKNNLEHQLFTIQNQCGCSDECINELKGYILEFLQDLETN